MIPFSIQTYQNTVLAASACRDVARRRPRPPERATNDVPGIRKRTPYMAKPVFYITECEMVWVIRTGSGLQGSNNGEI
jgi:hypothetical protein